MAKRPPLVPWHRLPTPLGISRLFRIRQKLRRDNLHDTGVVAATPPPSVPPLSDEALTNRTVDGTHNDLRSPNMGRAGTRFGRNVPLGSVRVDEARLLQPNPRTVSVELMTRHDFKPAKILNLLAAAWIQFEVHDWFSHGANDRTRDIEIPLAPDDPWPVEERPMKVRRTSPDPTRTAESDPSIPTFVNTETHWWDASQVYGSDPATQQRLRAGRDGLLTMDANGRLPEDPAHPGHDLTGVNGNYWVGLSLLHTLFAREHNAICGALKSRYPSWTDDQLFHKARLINAALMAKIHTIEWTPGILPHKTVGVAMNGNWSGLADRIYRHLGRVGSDVLTGIPGSETDHHAAPYSITEEFVAVYRMHPLIPDDYVWRSLSGASERASTFADIAGSRTRSAVDQLGLADLFYSFGLMHPGAITLNNFPRHLQRLQRDDGPTIDLAAVDILRDRERGVPRYNEFRRLFDLPPLTSIEELAQDAETAARLRRVYGNDIDSVDLLVGLLAEQPPEGFGFSETAFRVFVLMASRRLKSDRFFTTHYRPEVYTPLGIDWVEQNSMISVLTRHFPGLAPALAGVPHAFAPWNRV